MHGGQINRDIHDNMIVIDIVVPQCIVLVFRKVEDLQFTIEEETITKDELEVK